MATNNTYIQQIRYDGNEYTKGTVVDLLQAFNIICKDFPFVKNPKSKELPSHNWHDEDGVDVYIPAKIPLEEYDMEVSFIYTCVEDSSIQERDEKMRIDISNFIDFLYGRVKGNPNDSFSSGRLAIYNEYVGMGRKDVYVKEVKNEIYEKTESDPDAVAVFNVKFAVCDPSTEVRPIKDNHSIVNDLFF